MLCQRKKEYNSAKNFDFFFFPTWWWPFWGIFCWGESPSATNQYTKLELIQNSHIKARNSQSFNFFPQRRNLNGKNFLNGTHERIWRMFSRLIQFHPFIHGILPFPEKQTTFSISSLSETTKEKLSSFNKLRSFKNLTTCFTNRLTSLDGCFLNRFTCLPISVSYKSQFHMWKIFTIKKKKKYKTIKRNYLESLECYIHISKTLKQFHQCIFRLPKKFKT